MTVRWWKPVSHQEIKRFNKNKDPCENLIRITGLPSKTIEFIKISILIPGEQNHFT